MKKITCLVGKPPRPGTIFDVLPKRLAEAGIAVSVEVPREGKAAELGLEDPHGLIVHRGLGRDLLEWLSDAEQRGWTCCNHAGSSLRVQDRGRLMSLLDGAGLPVPAWRVLGRWTEARAVSGKASVVVKAAAGARGRGSKVLMSGSDGLPQEPPFPGPYLVEERVENDGFDRKLYVAGSACFGLLKPWPRDALVPPVAFEVPTSLQDVALAAGRATGLEIFGVDAVVGPHGPMIVDVNVFPSFGGVGGAVEAIVQHLLRRAAA